MNVDYILDGCRCGACRDWIVDGNEHENNKQTEGESLLLKLWLILLIFWFCDSFRFEENTIKTQKGIILAMDSNTKNCSPRKKKWCS